MKHMPLFFVFALSLFIVGCQESSSKKNSSNSTDNYCSQNPWACGTTGWTTGGSTGTGSCSGDSYWTQAGCAGYCQHNPTHTSCTSGSTTGSTTGGTTTGGTTYPPYINPFPNYYSGYVDKNWLVHYPYKPSISCTEAVTPSGITYTPYETRKGSITLKGQVDYDFATNNLFFDTTSQLLQTKDGAMDFFWGDSTLKVRFKANLQPESANTTTLCPNRKMGYSSIKGYGKIRFDLYLVGKKTENGAETTISLGTKVVSVNTCTPAINLASYAAQYPAGIYLKVKNVYGNQGWLPGTDIEQYYYDIYGFISPQNKYLNDQWKLIRNMECWSLDMEVAADGTKTFN